jgi:hypothetical protein
MIGLGKRPLRSEGLRGVRNRNLMFAVFAGMLPCSMLREWSAPPAACARPGLMRFLPTQTAC